ncbi:hypothetical protein INT48_008257 [Thamnidium elegans]|uniref:Uncharacterized protein n=1 Tax=Thamnidium elegans TaxID=101142 RepID=A0A8H7SNP4_9FUNG|nr:hypothetical protein INT48_008257 [Thamnidium elegans]
MSFYTVTLFNVSIFAYLSPKMYQIISTDIVTLDTSGVFIERCACYAFTRHLIASNDTGATDILIEEDVIGFQGIEEQEKQRFLRVDLLSESLKPDRDSKVSIFI